MKILWISDFGIHHNIGGAQRSNEIMIDAGIARGHRITPFHYDSNLELLKDDYDIVLSSNLEVLHNNNEVFKYIINHPNHVRYEHDSNSYLSSEKRNLLFGSAKLSVMLSELHFKNFVNSYGDIFKNEVAIVSDPISKEFHNYERSRFDATLYVGFFHYLKGTNNFINHVAENPKENFVVAGWGSSSFIYYMQRLPNVEYLGKVGYGDMPGLFNSYKSLYYKPVKYEPFCRTVSEAILCGVEIECNDIIGGFEEFKKLGIEEFSSSCYNADENFWCELEKV